MAVRLYPHPPPPSKGEGGWGENPLVKETTTQYPIEMHPQPAAI